MSTSCASDGRGGGVALIGIPISILGPSFAETFMIASSWDKPALGTGPSKFLGQARSWDRPFKILGTSPLLGQALQNNDFGAMSHFLQESLKSQVCFAHVTVLA